MNCSGAWLAAWVLRTCFKLSDEEMALEVLTGLHQFCRVLIWICSSGYAKLKMTWFPMPRVTFR